MALKRGYKQLIADATARVRTLSVDEAQAKLGDPGVVFVDVRETGELEREGTVPGAFHAARGMLEFWVDPESPYYKQVFDPNKQFVLYCASAWRSALAADVARHGPALRQPYRRRLLGLEEGRRAQ